MAIDLYKHWIQKYYKISSFCPKVSTIFHFCVISIEITRNGNELKVFATLDSFCPVLVPMRQRSFFLERV